MEPFLKEHVRGIVERCREAGFPITLIKDPRGGGAIVLTAALPAELIGQAERYHREIVAFLLSERKG